MCCVGKLKKLDFWVGAQWFGGGRRGSDGHGESPELCPLERECLLKDDLMAGSRVRVLQMEGAQTSSFPS